MGDYPQPGNNVFSADEEKAMRQGNRPMNINPNNAVGNDLRQPKGAQVGGADTGALDQLRPTTGLY